MSGADVAVLITAIAVVIGSVAAVVTALGGLAIALGALIPILRRTRKDVAEVHTMVNQQRTDMMLYQTALITALHKAGAPVPDDASLKGK